MTYCVFNWDLIMYSKAMATVLKRKGDERRPKGRHLS